MKKTMLFIFLVSLLFIGSCEKAEPDSDYSIQYVKEPLSPDDIETVFDFLGLKIERFSYNLPQRTPVSFFSQKYINGVPQRITNNSILYLDAGTNNMMLFIHKQNDSISFSVRGPVGQIGCGNVNIEGYSAFSQRWMNPEELNSGPEVPLYVFAANKNGIEGISPNYTVEDIVNKYELVFILYADIP